MTQNKQQILDDLVAHLSERLDQAQIAVGLRRVDAEPIEQDEHRADDVSHQDEAGDMHAMFQEVDDNQQEKVDAAKALERGPSETVEPGAVITMDGANYVVGIAVDEFTSGDATYMGISTDAPMYEAMVGKRAGDTVEFNGRTSTITDVA